MKDSKITISSKQLKGFEKVFDEINNRLENGDVPKAHDLENNNIQMTVNEYLSLEPSNKSYGLIEKDIPDENDSPGPFRMKDELLPGTKAMIIKRVWEDGRNTSLLFKIVDII